MRTPAITATSAPVAAPSRNVALDGLRVVLACMVAGLHGHLLADASPRLGAALQHYLFRTAVPVFFIINGFFFFHLLQRGKPMRQWALRILTLYLTWSAVYGHFIFADGLAAGLKVVLVHQGYWHLWYLPATALAGALVYFLRGWHTRTLAALMAAAYMGAVALQYAGNYHLFTGDVDVLLNTAFLYRNFLLFAFPMFGLGFLLAREGAVRTVSGRTAAAALVLGLLSLATEYALNSTTEGFDVLLSLPLLCAGIFLLAARVPQRPLSLDLAGISALIYFAHPLFLMLLPVASATPRVLASIACCLALYPAVSALNRRWPVFL